jgi:hypothetical protein
MFYGAYIVRLFLHISLVTLQFKALRGIGCVSFPIRMKVAISVGLVSFTRWETTELASAEYYKTIPEIKYKHEQSCIEVLFSKNVYLLKMPNFKDSDICGSDAVGSAAKSNKLRCGSEPLKLLCIYFFSSPFHFLEVLNNFIDLAIAKLSRSCLAISICLPLPPS